MKRNEPLVTFHALLPREFPKNQSPFKCGDYSTDFLSAGRGGYCICRAIYAMMHTLCRIYNNPLSTC